MTDFMWHLKEWIEMANTSMSGSEVNRSESPKLIEFKYIFFLVQPFSFNAHVFLDTVFQLFLMAHILSSSYLYIYVINTVAKIMFKFGLTL
jgi:hypothetical protein